MVEEREDTLEMKAAEKKRRAEERLEMKAAEQNAAKRLEQNAAAEAVEAVEGVVPWRVASGTCPHSLRVEAHGARSFMNIEASLSEAATE